MTIRYDSSPIKARFDDAGYLRDEPVVARTGILTYRNSDGSKRNELRLAEDVFAPESLESYSGQAITIGHAAMVNSKNFKQHGVGTLLGNGRQDGENVRAPIIIQEERGIAAARDQKFNQLSVGYNVNYVERSGMYNTLTGEAKFDDERGDKAGDQEFIGKEWVRFDGVQKDIRVNHVALVKKARAGAVARLNMDGDEELDYNGDDNSITEGVKMKTIRLDSGVEVQVDEHVATYVETLVSQAKTEKTRADSLDTQKTELQVQVDTLKQTVDGIPAQLESARKDAADLVKNRSALESQAVKFGVKDVAGVSDLDLKKKVIGVTSKINLDGKDESYINVAFDMAVNSNHGIAEQRRKVNGNGGDQSRNDAADGVSAAADARKKMQEKLLKGGK